jgi:hypothetical protein
MKHGLNLAGLVLSAGIALSSTGCATWPTALKVAATPVALVRDVVDIPLASGVTFFDYVAEGKKEDLGNTESRSGYGWTKNGGDSWHGGWGLGVSMDLTYPFGKFMSGVLAVPDYVVSRSLCGSLEGKSPWKKNDEIEDQTWGEYLFPNMNELWAEPKKKIVPVVIPRYKSRY